MVPQHHAEEGNSQHIAVARVPALTRRDLGRYAALTAVGAGFAGIVPRVAVAQSANGTPDAAPAHPLGGSVTIAHAGDADSLDPAHTTGPSWHVLNNLYDSVDLHQRQLQYEGVLAESWDISDDGLEYTFHLRPGITFHDGTELNAEAVKFTFDRLIDPETNAPAAGWIRAAQRDCGRRPAAPSSLS